MAAILVALMSLKEYLGFLNVIDCRELKSQPIMEFRIKVMVMMYSWHFVYVVLIMF